MHAGRVSLLFQLLSLLMSLWRSSIGVTGQGKGKATDHSTFFFFFLFSLSFSTPVSPGREKKRIRSTEQDGGRRPE